MNRTAAMRSETDGPGVDVSASFSKQRTGARPRAGPV